MNNDNLPVVAQYKPYLTAVEEGRTYLWCRCGLSRSQPFCDQSHVGTSFKPVRYRAEASASVLLCGCKHTANPPFCDGSHNNLADEYAEDERPRDELLAATELVDSGVDGIAWLDGGCYVKRADSLVLPEAIDLPLVPVIDSLNGAKNLSQYYAEIGSEPTPVMAWPGADTLVYVLAGAGEIIIGGRHFALSAESGAYVKGGESVCLHAAGSTMKVLLTICPAGVATVVRETMDENFDHSQAERIGVRDPSLRNVMANRFYQVLIGEDNGSDEIAQFIGEVPKSKAAPHRHLYEEAIVILSGSGMMWTERKRTPVAPGDIIFLPAQQEHSLECTSSDGLALAGHFYPSGSPNINY